jgi:hypothetical protein
MGATVYSYHPQTGAYNGTSVADDNPEEPGELLYPAFTTTVEPPDVPEGSAVFWRGESWEVMRQEASLPPPLEGEQDETARFARMKLLAQARLDGDARVLGYDDILSAVTYADEPSVPRFQQEGLRLRRLRSLVWNEHNIICEEVKGGARCPSEDEFLSRLPTYGEVVIMEQQEAGP